jgi:cold shock CspA family protein
VEVEFGHVQKYDTVRGFGFVSRTFRNANRRHENNVWFHITKIKRDYPNLAKELDAGSLEINFGTKLIIAIAKRSVKSG